VGSGIEQNHQFAALFKILPDESLFIGEKAGARSDHGEQTAISGNGALTGQDDAGDLVILIDQSLPGHRQAVRSLAVRIFFPMAAAEVELFPAFPGDLDYGIGEQLFFTFFDPFFLAVSLDDQGAIRLDLVLAGLTGLFIRITEFEVQTIRIIGIFG